MSIEQHIKRLQGELDELYKVKGKQDAEALWATPAKDLDRNRLYELIKLITEHLKSTPGDCDDE